MYLELSGYSVETVMRLLPANTCPPTPIRKAGLPDHASASRKSLMAPRTLLRSVTVTVSVGAPMISWRVRLVSKERSRNVDALNAPVHDWPIGMTPSTAGNRAVVVFACPSGVVTRRNSGEY